MRPRPSRSTPTLVRYMKDDPPVCKGAARRHATRLTAQRAWASQVAARRVQSLRREVPATPSLGPTQRCGLAAQVDGHDRDPFASASIECALAVAAVFGFGAPGRS